MVLLLLPFLFFPLLLLLLVLLTSTYLILLFLYFFLFHLLLLFLLLPLLLLLPPSPTPLPSPSTSTSPLLRLVYFSFIHRLLPPAVVGAANSRQQSPLELCGPAACDEGTAGGPVPPPLTLSLPLKSSKAITLSAASTTFASQPRPGGDNQAEDAKRRSTPAPLPHTIPSDE